MLAACIYAVLHWRVLPEKLIAIKYYIVISLVVQLVGGMLWFFNINNLFLLHFYVPTAFILLIWFYRRVWYSYISSTLLSGLLYCFILFSLLNSIFLQDIFSFNTHGLTGLSILIIIFSLSNYYLFLDANIRIQLGQLITSINWINTGLFIYYTCTFLYHIYGRLINFDLPQSIGRLALLPNALFVTIKYVCFFIGLWKSPKRQSLHQS